MKTIANVVLACVLAATPVTVRAADFPMERIHGSGGSLANRVNIMIVGDGWTAAQITAGAYSRACVRLKDRLIALKPFAEYKNLLNVLRVDVPSTQAGTSHELGNVRVDNYFGTYFSKTTVDGRDTDDRGVWFRSWSRSRRLLGEVNPRTPRNVILVLINDATYGGAAMFLGSAAQGVGTVTTHADAGDVFVHELGHALVNLADEYDYGGHNAPRREPAEANVTIESDPTRVKWKHWIEARVPGIGVHRGAQYCQNGVYRPKANCLMKALNQEMCEVCLERAVQRFFENVSLIDDSLSNQAAITLTVGRGFGFYVATVAPERPVLEAQWFLDGRRVAGTETAGTRGPVYRIDLTPAQLPAGNHTLRFVVQDKTPLTANWPATVRTHAPSVKQWAIAVRAAPNGLPALRAAR